MVKVTGTFIITVVWASCCFGQVGKHNSSPISINWNDNINAVSRNQINSLDQKMLTAFYENNTQKLVSLYSHVLLVSSGNKNEHLVNEIHTAVKDKKYTIVDECLAIDPAMGTTATVFKNAPHDNAYKMHYTVYYKETYISLFVYKGALDQLLFTCFYGKENSGWRLVNFVIAKYKILGKTAVDYFKEAKKEYDAHDLIDAVDDIRTADQIGTPAGDRFEYIKFPEMKVFANKLDSEVRKKYVLPIIVSGITTAPKIFLVEPVEMNEGIFPVVYYLTKINLKDIVALQAENEQIKKVIGKIFSEIGEDKKYVFFKAFNSMPNGITPLEHYGFMLKKDQK